MTPTDFAVLMQRELDANAHKGDWDEWEPILEVAVSELVHHADKLRIAMLQERSLAVTEHAADLGNICMKIAEQLGRSPDGRGE